MINVIIYLILIFIGSFSLNYFLDKNTPSTIPITNLLSILILYVFGILNILTIGFYFFVFLLIIGFIAAISMCIYRKKKILKYFSPYIFVYGLLVILIVYFNKDRLFVEWDEFSHWGKTIKNMYYLNSLANENYKLLYKSYPPATAVFQYFLLQLKGSYNEGLILSSLPILYFSLVMPFFKNIKSKSVLSVGLITLGIIIVPIVFYGNFFTSIYVDAILGILFSYIILTHFYEENQIIKAAGIIIASMVLCLTKSSGQGLAIVALLIISIDSMYKYKQKPGEFNLKETLLYFKNQLLMLSGLLFAYFSWKIYMHLNGIVNTRDLNGSVIGLLIDNFVYHQGIGTTVVRSFISFIVKSTNVNSIFPITNLGVIFIFIIISLIILSNVKDDMRRRSKILFVSLTLGCIVYLISLCLVYIFSFSEYEALRLASVERYVNTYMLAFLVILTGSVINNFADSADKSKIIPITILLLCVLTNFTPIYEIAVDYKAQNCATQNYRKSYSDLHQYTDIINEDDNLSLLCTEGQGLENLIYQYEYMESLNISGYESIGTAPYYEGDIWTKVLTFEEYELYLKSSYDYLYIMRVNEKYNKDYGNMFEEGYAENYTLYYIDKNVEGGICVKKVNNCTN